MDNSMSQEFKRITAELEEVFISKNTDYGSAVDITHLMLGETAQLVPLWNKLMRVTQLILSGNSYVKSESVEDTLKDMANYAIIALAQRRVYNNPPAQELGDVFRDFLIQATEKKRVGDAHEHVRN